MGFYWDFMVESIGFYDFPFIWEWNVIIPTDELIFFRGVGIAPTRNWLENHASPHGECVVVTQVSQDPPSPRQTPRNLGGI